MASSGGGNRGFDEGVQFPLHVLLKAGSYASDEQKAAAKKQAESLLARAKAGESIANLATRYSGTRSPPRTAETSAS